MAIKNNRKSILSNNPSEDRLKSKLKENYKRFLSEAPGDEESEDDTDADLDTDAAGDAGAEGGLDLGADAGAEGGEGLDGLDSEGGEGLGDDGLADEGSEDPIADLTDEQAETVDNWVDELLQDSLDSVEVDGAESLDTELPADEIDPLGDEQVVHDGSPLTVDTLENIIDSDNSLEALEQELATLATEETPVEGEEGLEGAGLGDDLSDDLSDDSEELDEQSRAWNLAKGNRNPLAEEEAEEGGEELNEWGASEHAEYDHEAGKPKVDECEINEEEELEEGVFDAIKGGVKKVGKFVKDEISPSSVKPGGKYHGKGVSVGDKGLSSNLGGPMGEAEELDEVELAAAIRDLGFDQGFEGEQPKDELVEDVELAAGNKELGFEETKEGLNDKITSKVSDGGVKGGAQSNVDEVNESIKKSKMLVTSAAVIAKLQESIKTIKAEKEALKLENYKLVKANGILSVAGDKLTKEARTKISESFDQCKTVEQVNAFYTKLTENIKKLNRPSLNEAVASKKTKIQQIKESVNKAEAETKAPINESVTPAQNRINYLMGYGDKDAYFEF